MSEQQIPERHKGLYEALQEEWGGPSQESAVIEELGTAEAKVAELKEVLRYAITVVQNRGIRPPSTEIMDYLKAPLNPQERNNA